MSAGAGPMFERAGSLAAAREPPDPATSQDLRLPEDRAFDVATINGRLARMARQAAPQDARRRLRS